MPSLLMIARSCGPASRRCETSGCASWTAPATSRRDVASQRRNRLAHARVAEPSTTAILVVA